MAAPERKYMMGDKGKKDKDKAQKQKVEKQKRFAEKTHANAPIPLEKAR